MAGHNEPRGMLVDALGPAAGVLTRQSARRAAERIHDMGDEAELVVRTPGGDLERLPHAFVHMMASMLGELAEGHTVAVVTEAEEVSTSVAATFLGVSRPHVVKLVDSGLLPHRMAGTHRRVRVTDLVAYKRGVDRRHSFLDDLMAETEAMGLYDPGLDRRER